jgi:hypothetical protein
MISYPKTSGDGGREPTKRLSKKELSKKFRHEAYLRAKEFRKTDPRQIAMAEKLKEQRKEAYQKAKDRGKAYRAELKNKSDERAAKKKVLIQKKLSATIQTGSAIMPSTQKAPRFTSSSSEHAATVSGQ